MTPQMQANNLPMVSPQAQMPVAAPQQQLSLGQITPQSQNQQLQMPQQNVMHQAGSMIPPPQQRSVSQSQGLPQMAMPSQGSSWANSGADVQTMIQGWGDNQLLKSTMAVVGKIHQSAQPSVSSISSKASALIAGLW